MDSLERIPYLATAASETYESIPSLPVIVLLDNVRSAYNVGAFFRTGDATAIEHLYLCGITGCPPGREVTKTALGAEETVPWSYSPSPLPVLDLMREKGCEVAAIETNVHAIDLFDWKPRFPVCVLFGNETDGLQPDVASRADTYVRIPMLGRKHSLNVATAGGVVLFELLRKYRELAKRS